MKKQLFCNIFYIYHWLSFCEIWNHSSKEPTCKQKLLLITIQSCKGRKFDPFNGQLHCRVLSIFFSLESVTNCTPAAKWGLTRSTIYCGRFSFWEKMHRFCFTYSTFRLEVHFFATGHGLVSPWIDIQRISKAYGNQMRPRRQFWYIISISHGMRDPVRLEKMHF